MTNVARRFYNSSEVAQILGLEPKTVRDMARRQTLPAVKLGSVWLFPMAAIDRLGEPNQGEPRRESAASFR